VTSLGTDLRQVVVTVSIRNRITLEFDGGQQEVSSMIARFRTGFD
jgi:hypothetical protein